MQLEVVYVGVDGKPYVDHVDNLEAETLAHLIGARFVEQVRLTDELSLLVDEEGLLQETPRLNPNACRLVNRAWGRTDAVVAGDCVIVRNAGPDWTPVTKADQDLILDTLAGW